MGKPGSWRRVELVCLVAYAVAFEGFVIWRSAMVSTEYGSGHKAGWLYGLKPGWISHRQMDLSDSQWRTFRAALPALTAVMGLFTVMSGGMRARLHLAGRGMGWFWLLASLVYVVYLHGACVVFILAIGLGNFAFVKLLGGTHALPVMLWMYNLAFLVGNRIFEGYQFCFIWFCALNVARKHFAYLDDHRGAMRWHISFNMVMLRMVSYGLDYHWARISRPSTVNWEKHMRHCSLCQSGVSCYVSRQEKALSSDEYNLVTYLAYILYAPLYLAGPIISFNAFASQLETPQKSYNRRQIASYGLRWLACFLLMELLTHFCYFNSLAISGVWQMLSPTEIFIVGYGVLNFMWLKFLLIWRFFRFWALVGGIEVPENMVRCVNNCCDIEGFWKSWHASYNRYLVRYLYIPLGGAKWRLVNVWLIFTFVALWHDIEWKLLSWAWVTCVLWAPELLAKSLMSSPRMSSFKKSQAFRECCAVAGSLNITGLMMANLVGFVVGPAGIRLLASRLISIQSIPLLLDILLTFYVGTKIMLAIRERAAQHEDSKKQYIDKTQID